MGWKDGVQRFSVRAQCPLCEFGRVLQTRGSRAVLRGESVDPEEFRFGRLDLETMPLIDVRYANGRHGDPPGFPRCEERCLTLREACGVPELKGLVDTLLRSAREIVSVIEEERGEKK